jgi:hypothetical protein
MVHLHMSATMNVDFALRHVHSGVTTSKSLMCVDDTLGVDLNKGLTAHIHIRTT